MIKNNRIIALLLILTTLLLLAPSIALAGETETVGGNDVVGGDPEVHEEEPMVDFDNERINKGLSGLQELVQKVSNYAIAFTLFVSVAVLMILFFKLATAYNHPLHRRKILEEIGVVLVTTAVLGSGGLMLRVLAGFFS